jgi:hypothetical protein
MDKQKLKFFRAHNKKCKGQTLVNNSTFVTYTAQRSRQRHTQLLRAPTICGATRLRGSCTCTISGAACRRYSKSWSRQNSFGGGKSCRRLAIASAGIVWWYVGILVVAQSCPLLGTLVISCLSIGVVVFSIRVAQTSVGVTFDVPNSLLN